MMNENNNSQNNSQKDFSNYKESQILRIDGKNCFLEVMIQSLNIGKIQINLMKYDTNKQKNSRITDKIAIYLDIPKAKSLCNDILSGRIPKLIQLEKERIENQTKKNPANKVYPKSIYDIFGGTSTQRLAQQGKSRSDGKAVSRVFRIIPGMKADCMFCGELGPGNETSTGAIQPIINKAEIKIQVPVTFESLKEFALMVDMNINAYCTAQHTVRAFEEKRKAKNKQ
ncbi:hypothetical protein [Clostridium perfringens]|uniref:Uncharacterized protein n=1 Tax=Clostridium perfringens TaxID=1502 RepID=A0A140GR11_CLOPF|nr:hypothetical protein [Clostridium perfringens]AMN30970.1 hypothetical protein JFP838_pA0054 [Clostridium perfringens]